ncbi:unnamed protein product, partial [Mycena citricolor]
MSEMSLHQEAEVISGGWIRKSKIERRRSSTGGRRERSRMSKRRTRSSVPLNNGGVLCIPACEVVGYVYCARVRDSRTNSHDRPVSLTWH